MTRSTQKQPYDHVQYIVNTAKKKSHRDNHDYDNTREANRFIARGPNDFAEFSNRLSQKALNAVFVLDNGIVSLGNLTCHLAPLMGDHPSPALRTGSGSPLLGLAMQTMRAAFRIRAILFQFNAT